MPATSGLTQNLVNGAKKGPPAEEFRQ